MTSGFVLVLELIGTFAFALSGATMGVRRQLDLFGVLVLSFAAATAGGIVRDALIGATPPVALADWRYLVIAMIAGLVTFFRYDFVQRLRHPVQFSDALGLGLFAVSGATKATAFGIGPTGAILLGILSGVGGGVVRDMLVAEVPSILRRGELYAVAAALGASIVVAGQMLGLPSTSLAIGGAAACFLLRYLSIRRRWMLPVASVDGGE